MTSAFDPEFDQAQSELNEARIACGAAQYAYTQSWSAAAKAALVSAQAAVREATERWVVIAANHDPEWAERAGYGHLVVRP
jgi:hypothetical protein